VNIAGYSVLAGLLLAGVLWLVDFDELWNGEATAYLVTCPDITGPGHCNTRRIIFRASVDEQSVSQLYNNAPPFRLIGACIVRDPRNWQCNTLKSGNYARSMTDGHYQSILDSETIEHGTWKLKWVIYTLILRVIDQ
jgi:hypothetical protein